MLHHLPHEKIVLLHFLHHGASLLSLQSHVLLLLGQLSSEIGYLTSVFHLEDSGINAGIVDLGLLG